jgi:hypothetical protein
MERGRSGTLGAGAGRDAGRGGVEKGERGNESVRGGMERMLLIPSRMLAYSEKRLTLHPVKQNQ